MSVNTRVKLLSSVHLGHRRSIYTWGLTQSLSRSSYIHDWSRISSVEVCCTAVSSKWFQVKVSHLFPLFPLVNSFTTVTHSDISPSIHPWTCIPLIYSLYSHSKSLQLSWLCTKCGIRAGKVLTCSLSIILKVWLTKHFWISATKVLNYETAH